MTRHKNKGHHPAVLFCDWCRVYASFELAADHCGTMIIVDVLNLNSMINHCIQNKDPDRRRFVSLFITQYILL